MNVAIVYDRVNTFGGAERVLLSLLEIWPNAVLYTSVYDSGRATWSKIFPKVIPSFIQKIPFFRSNHELIPYLMPYAFESFNFDYYDLVISVTSESAKGIITKPKTCHICYCLTPTRYLWSGYVDYKRIFNSLPMSFIYEKLFDVTANWLKEWDIVASNRPDFYIAISKTVQKRIFQFYKKDSIVIYPPVDTQTFSPLQGTIERSYYLVVSRLVASKKIDLIIEAFNILGLSLIIVGDGKERKNLQREAHKNIQFTGKISEPKLLELYQNAKGVILAADEDFGLVPIEAQACGVPVIAYHKGGAIETVIKGKSGEFFQEQTALSIISCVRKFEKKQYNTTICRENSLQFNKQMFKKKFIKLVENHMGEYNKR